jgi:hypothetical protein
MVMSLPQNWKTVARCRGMGTEWFFPPTETNPQAPGVRQARAVCRHRRVARECLAEALAARDVHGIRAGLTEVQRAALLRRKPAASHSPGAIEQGRYRLMCLPRGLGKWPARPVRPAAPPGPVPEMVGG